MKPSRSDTIAAIATGPGRGGVGIVRISGSGLLPFAAAITGRDPARIHARRAAAVDFLAADGTPLDQGLLLFFPAPHSFTGEDVVELQGHGGPVVLQMLLARCVELGARLAEPGEFSQRAFLNEKLDLAQAEAVADLIEAGSAAAVRSAMRSLSGEFSAAVAGLVQQLIELRTLVEATLDFPEEEVDVVRDTDALARLARFQAELEALRRRSRQGALLRAGLHVVLAGQANVGKSSLLNRLAGEERAIVTDIAGTTRDALRETIQIEGIPLHIVDTAGLRETGDVVERLGIERSWQEIGRADVVLQVVDARQGVVAEEAVLAEKLPAGVPRVVIENKCDLAGREPARIDSGAAVHLVLSAKTGAGLELLKAELLRIAGWSGHGEDAILARERHLAALAVAAEKSTQAARCLDRLELCAEELRLAQQALSAITGEFTADDLLGEIFGRFCIGK